MKKTGYEIVGMIKDGKAPKKIRYDDKDWYKYNDYYCQYRHTKEHYDLNILAFLDKEFEIGEEPILTDKEREYLSKAIEPFRNNIKDIIKHKDYGYLGEQYLVASLPNSTMTFPRFEKDTMYKNMELGKSYTLEELGL